MKSILTDTLEALHISIHKLADLTGHECGVCFSEKNAAKEDEDCACRGCELECEAMWLNETV